MSAIPILTPYAAKSMSTNEKKLLALSAIGQQTTISDIANKNNISRQFIYAQKNKALAAINEVFSEDNGEEVLFNLPVTKDWLRQFVVSLVFDCHSCFRGVIKSMENLLDYPMPIGSVFNIIQSLIPEAKTINIQQDLSAVKLCAQDELFHHNKPVLTGIDIPSLYCYLLAQAEQRDGETWAIHLLDLEIQHFNPARVIADDGDGLRFGHHLVFPNTPCDADNFHITKTLMELRRFFRNRLRSAISYRLSIECKMEKAKLSCRSQKYARTLGLARQNEKEAHYLSESIDTLVSWMEHDIFNMAGTNPTVRRELFDFVVAEFEKLEKIHPHRIRVVRVTLSNQRDLLLAFTDVLNEKFKIIAAQCKLPLETIWKMCELQRCKHGSDHYAIRSLPLQFQLSETYDDVEDAVIAAMSTTERTSSMVENLNSRLRPYFFLRREIGNGYLDLLQFYLNHTPFLRSANPNRAKKSPAELLTNTPHDNWLELLGFKRFKRAA
jgi:hypothetical protein